MRESRLGQNTNKTPIVSHLFLYQDHDVIYLSSLNDAVKSKD